MAERPLYTLYKNLKAQNYDVPDDYNKFESALTRDGKGGADNRHAIYENLKAQNFDVPNTYERFYSALFEPRSKTSSRAKGGSVPMTAADRARFSAGAEAISASAQHTMNNSGRYNRLKQRKQKQQKDFGRVNLGTHQTPYGGDANNVVKDDFAYNPETGKAGAYVSSDNENVYSHPEAEQKQAVLDQQNNAYQEAVDTGEIPSVFDVRDKNGNYDLQENINKNGTYLTEEGARNQFDKKLADAYARKKEIEALIAEDHRQHGNPLLSYGASIGASNGRTAEQSDYSNKLATSLALVKQQIGALEAVKQYPTSSWGEDALKALDNTAFTAKTWDFGLTDFATMGQMERIKTKMDNNLPLSGSDKMLLKSKLGADAAAALEDEKMGNIYRWTKIAGQSLPFMADFFLTGGYGGITKAISRGALKFAAKRGMGKVSAAILKNTGIVAGDVIGSYAMAGSEQAMKTGADIMQRHLGSLYQDEKGDYKFGTFDENGNLLHEGGESMGTALYKGLTSAMVENYTEKLFGHSYGIKKGAINFMEKHGMNASAEFFKNIGKSGWYTNSKKWMEKFGINGFGEEVMEEEIGIPLHALLDGDNKFSDLLDTKQQLDIIGGMALSVGSMYAMGAGSRPVKGVYNRAQYYRFRNKVNVADSDAQNLMGDKWADIKDKIDNTTNEQMGGVLADILRQRDTMSKDQINAAINYGINLMKMRGYNVAKTAEMNAREITNEPTTPEEQHQEDIDNAYSEGHDADDADKHDIQLEHEDQMKTLAGLLNISEQQLSAMNDDELQSLTGQNDKLDQAIYDYQLSSARYQGVTDDAQDKIDMAANQAAQRVDMYTDKSRGSVRNATVKASGGAEDYGVYIISGNIATNEDGSINVADSDDMILFYDPTTNSVEHADALRFAELGDEVPADDVKAQAVADAKEKAIKEVAGIVDGTIDVGSQFKVTGADGLEHTYEILADYGDGTAAISIDGNVVENPYSLEDLQQLKDLEDQKRLEAAKAQREQMEKERATQQIEQTQETEQPEETQPSLDFNQILNDNGNVVLVDVLDKDGNTKYPDSKLFLIRDTGAKAKVVEMKSDGTFVPHAVSKKNVATISSMSLDEYKQAMAETSMIEENSGSIEADRGGIEVDEELPPVPDNVTINGDGTYTEDGVVHGGENKTAPAEQTPAAPAMTLEDGTIVPMLEDGNPDFSKLTADQTAELYDSQFGEDADSVISGWVSDAKKALDKANNMTVKGKNFVEQKAAKEAKEKAIADAQAAYDSAVAIRDAYNERQLAKVEDTAEGRKNLIEKARRKFARFKSAVKDDAEAVSQLYKDVVGSLLHRLYDGTGIDVTDTIPLTAEEYVASNLGAHSLNYEGTETSKGVKQETGLSREDFAKTQLLAADGKGTTIDDLVHSLWENRPSNLDSLDTQDIRNALIGVLTSGFKASEARNYIENLRIVQAENILEEQKKAAANAAFAEEQKAKQEEKKAEEEKTEENEKINEQTNENINTPELSQEQQKAMEDGEKLGFPAFDKEGEPINEYVIELANWAKEQGLEIDPTSKSNSYADLFLMCKDGFGVSTLVPDEGENINQVVYFPDNVQDFDQLWKLQEEFNAGRDLKHSSNIDSEITEGATFYDADTAREFKEFVDKKVEEQNKVFGEQRPEEDLPFSAKENGKQQTTAERAADVEKNKVDDMKVVDNIVGQKTRKAFERLAKMMSAKIQWQYSDKLGNGWIQETTDADGNVHRTIFITLDSSITEGAQFIFGHEMTHQIKNLNPAAYNELTQLVLDTYGSDAFDKAVDETMKRYSDAGFSGRDRDYYAEEVVADAVGEMIRDLNLAHTLAMKMSHPLLAAIHEILQKIKLAFYGTEYNDVTKNIIRSIEQAYVKTANGEVTNSETGEDVSFSLRQKPEPKKKGIGYKVFVLKDGKLYPPMVANPNGAATPVGVWLDADAAPIAGESKTGRPQVKQGGKGTQGGSGKLAYRPGWHLGVVPYAIQFNRKDAEGNKTLFPKNFVFAEVEYAADVDYQEEARQEGINPSGKYQHSLAGLKHLPTDGYYMYRTNPNPETDPWVITGAMKVNRILTRAEQAELVKNAGREPQQIQEGDIVTDDVVNSINQEIAAAPKFSLKVYHGSGADFTEFDFDHMGEGAGSQAFGWGGYVTSSKKIGKSYATLMDNDPSKAYYRIQRSNGTRFAKKYPTLESFLHGDKQIAMNDKFTEQEKIDYYNEMKKLAEPYHNLYEVDIPEDNGSNYLDWDAPITNELIDKVAKALPSLRSYDIKDLKKDRTFDNFYKTISMRSVTDDASFNDDKAASKFLASLGYTGIKYKAGRNFGGAEEGDTNYVIFKPEDMKITEHTKFSIKTYHGSQASFDKFDHSFMGSGEGAQAYGWGTYVSEVEGIAKAYAMANAKKNAPSRLMYQGKPMTYKTPSIIYQVALDMDKLNISAKEAISKMIVADEKKLESVGDTPFEKMKAKKVQDELKLLKGLNPSDFKINEDYDTVAQDLADTKSGLDLLEDELKDAKSYVDLYQSRLDEAKEELSKAKESGTGLGVDMYESDVEYYSGQVKRYKQTVETKESDIKDVKTKVAALQKKLDSMEKPRNLYSVDIPDDTGENYIGWDDSLTDKQIEMWKNAANSLAPKDDDGGWKERVDYYARRYGYNFKGEKAYKLLSSERTPKEVSMALKDAGFDGVKVIAQRNTGGNKDGKMNYVIFDENNAQIASHTKFSLKDNQGNPLNQDGTLKLDKIKSVDELTDEDFTDAFRNVELPTLPKNVDKAIGANGKPVVIKKNIFEKNWYAHKFTPTESKKVLNDALYNTDLVGHTQPTKKPNHWVAIKLDEKSPITVLEVNDNKDNVEVVGWYTLDERNLGRIKRQAERNGGELIMLTPKDDKVESLSTPPISSAAKIDNSSETTKENGEKVDSEGIKFSLKDEKIKSIAEKFGVNEDDVAMYANAVERGSTADAARARANIKRYLLQANEDKISSFKDIIKYTKPINEALKENFGDLDAMIEERRKQVEAQRNAMEAARKRAQEEEEKRQKHLDELSLIPTDELDNRYMDAIANNDESTAREMLDESARRNGYGDVDSDYQGQGAWAAPSNPQYESDEARRADIENSPDVNLEDIALGYNLQPDDYFDNPRAYMNNTAYGLESAHVIKNALDAIKNGEKDVKVKVYRAVPTSVKEGKLRNGDWVTPSKKYAEMHGDNRLDGKYRIIEDEVPANQLWWDGNDANEFGFDDGREYRYKNAKNNRKLNDLITYDNKGNVIPPSKRFNSRKNDIRFSLAGERGAAAADKAEERTIRMDNLSVAKDMEKNKKKAKAIKAATGWERGADGKWRYEMPDAKIKDTMDVGGGHIVKRYEDDMLWNGGKLSKVIDAPELFKAYPQLKDVRIDTDAIMNDMPSNGEYNAKTNTITIHADELKYMNSILNHEIQHVIQSIEGFDRGGSPRLVRGEIKKRLAEVTKQIRQLRAEGKEDEAKAIVEKNRGLYNAYQANDDYNSYKSLAGEVEARNVQERMNMSPEERRRTLAESTEDVARKDQIFLGVGDVSFSLRDMADGKESGAADMAEDLKSLNTPGEVDDAINTAIDDMPSGWQMANKKMIHIAQALGENRKAEIAGVEPKFSLKDGSLIKAGTYFSGGGLVEEGLKGIIDPVVAVEYDEKISGVYRNNFGQHIVTADVRDVDPKELVKQIDGEVEYFHASPVCKNYSQAKSNHTEVELDKETAASTAEFINAVKPKVVTIENVKGYKDSDAMKIITDALDANGYTWDADVYNAADYGGYTNRERLIVRAVRDGKLPEKPKKMAHKSGWYEAVADIIPTLTEKKNGVANWMDIRLKADGIDWRNIDKPLYVMGSAYADGKIPHAFADELLPTLRTKSGDVIVMPDGKVYRAMGRVLARVSGVSDDYKMPFSENLSHTIIGNGIPTQLTEHVIAPLLQNTLHPTTPEDGNTKFSLRYDKFEHDLNQWKKDNNLPKDAQRPTIPQRNAGESAVDFLRRVDEYRKQMALWKTAPTYEQHLLSDDSALGEFNRELQRGSVLKRIAFQDSMLAIRKAQEAIMKEVGVDRLNMAEDAYTAENRSHGKGKNEFEEYNNEFLQPLRKAYHQMKKVLGDSYDNVLVYMMAKHGLERDAQMAFKKSLEADYEDVNQRSAAYKAYKNDLDRVSNDADLEFGRVDFTTWRQKDNALRGKYSPSYMDYRYDDNGIAYDYSGLSSLFDGSDFEEAAHRLVRDVETKHLAEVQALWNATNAATKKILRDGFKAGMMSKDTYGYVKGMYSHYIPLRGWDGTTADQVWDYIGGGKGAFNQTLKTAHGRTSIADDPIAYIENMAESGILLNNKNWVKQHLMLLAQNHPTSLLTLSKAWYVKSTDANGNEEWIPATPQITSQMNSNQVKAAIDAFEQKMEQMAQTGDATQQRDGLNIAYPQTHSEEREHEVRVMKDGEEYVIYVNGDPQLAQAMNNTRAHRVREIQSGKLDRAAAWLGRKMAAAYTSLSPLFIPSNYFRDLTMTLASTAIREDAKYNYLLRKNLATSWNLGFMLRDYQNGKLRDKVNNGNATSKEQMFYDFMMNGGETGFVSSLDVEDLKKKFKNDLKDLDRWKANPVKVGHTIMDGIEFLNRMIEDSNRFAVYMTSIQYGRSIDEAVNDAKDVTLNFNRKGTGEYGWQMIRNLYLFINPAVQSLQTLGALAKHHPFKFTAVTAAWLASGVLVPIVNAALMSLLGGDDDKDKYWQFTKWDRRNNLIMWVPFTHEFVKIPLAQEFRAFYGVGDMIASKMMGGELAEETWSQYAEDLLGQVVDMLPLDPTGYDGNIAVSLMPNPIRPVFELAFNVDFTGKPLFKETKYNKYDPNFTKAYVGTPDWLVRVSKMVNSIGNDYPDVQQNAIDAFGDPRYNLNNPAVVDHVLSSYLGGAYTMGSQVLGVLTKSLNDPKEIKMADIPLVSKFVSNPDDRPVTKKQGDEFWNMKENHDRAANTLSKLKKQAKMDGDYSMLERFYGSEEYKQYKQEDVKVKKYEEDKKKERAEESGEEYRPHKLNAEDIYKAHATPKDDFEDLKLKQLYTKLNGFKTSYDLLVDTAPSQSDGYYNTNKVAIDAIDEISIDKQEISELKKGFLDDGKDAYNAEDMKRIRELRKRILSVLEPANKVVVANQKAKAEKK